MLGHPQLNRAYLETCVGAYEKDKSFFVWSGLLAFATTQKPTGGGEVRFWGSHTMPPKINL